jgi:hypothetical protein
MATNIVTGDVAACKIACMAADQLGINDFAWQFTATSGTVTYEDLVTNFNATIGPLYEIILPSTALYYGLSIQRVLPTKSQPITLADPSAGTAMGDLNPRQCAGIIAKKGTLADRPGRGRIYVPFLADSQTGDTGHLNTLGKTNLDAIGTQLFVPQSIDFGGGNVLGIVPVIRNFLTPFFNVITTFQTRLKIATQKRRGDYGRPNSAPW